MHPLVDRGLTIIEYAHEGACAGFGHGSKRFLLNRTEPAFDIIGNGVGAPNICLLYTSDAGDE